MWGLYCRDFAQTGGPTQYKDTLVRETVPTYDTGNGGGSVEVCGWRKKRGRSGAAGIL